MDRSGPTEHDPEMLTRYAFGDLSGEERAVFEQHLRSCPQCQEFLSFIQDFNSGLREAKPREPLPGEPCPDPALLDALLEDDLDDETAQHVRVHMLFCKACAKDYQALSKSRPKSAEAILRIARGLVHALHVSGVRDWTTSPRAIATRETMRLFVAPFRMSERFADPDSGTEITVILGVEGDVRPTRVRVVAECEPVPQGWRVSLLDGERDELVSFPLQEAHATVRSDLAYGFYSLQILKGDACLGLFDFTVGPFSLEEALASGLEYLRLRQYGRALTVLEDGTERFPDSPEMWDLQCLARDLAATDTEGIEREEAGLGQVRGFTDFLKESREFLARLRQRFGAGIAYTFAAAGLDVESYPADLPLRVKSEEVSVPVLLALATLKERVQGGDEQLAQLLSGVAARLDAFSAAITSLQASLDRVRVDVEKEVDEKFKAVSEILHSMDGAMTAQRLSTGDYSVVLRNVLGEEGWRWLEAEVKTIFISAEGLFWYLRTRQDIEASDFSPALLQFCRGLELLLNLRLGPVCDHIQERVSPNRELRVLAGSALPMINIEMVFRRKQTLSLTQIANFLRVGKAIVKARPSSLGENVGAILAGPRGLPEVEFIVSLEQVGMFFRNGKIHPRAGSPSLFTTAEEMGLLRKLMFGLDEERVDRRRLLYRLQNAAWLPAGERQEAYLKLSRAWEKYPGIVPILWRTLGTHDVPA